MNYAATDLIKQLRAARTALGLSQRELGERIGLAQSNIARLESGNTDPRLSNVLELARALDLDLKLVPRKALPAIDGALRASQLNIDHHDATSRAMHSIRQISEAIARIDTPKITIPDGLRKTIANLDRLRFDQAQFRALQDAFQPLQRTLNRLQETGEAPSEWSRRMRESNSRLQDLRNRMAHGSGTDESHLKPAFTLEDDDDD